MDTTATATAASRQAGLDAALRELELLRRANRAAGIQFESAIDLARDCCPDDAARVAAALLQASALHAAAQTVAAALDRLADAARSRGA